MADLLAQIRRLHHANTYHAYLLRLWRVHEKGYWHFALQDPHTGAWVYFADMEALLAFLQEQMAQSPGNFQQAN